ncbi:FAD-binding oxidoreductase [Thermopetrobacter sp. TC1]|uniref:FAD-binding oxidoreductase n=1 Tax=Thermopetrobacter sp. TC1 TaxID=1495045 RepID=UPI00068DF208|nr:FAD-binding oxidoreductase [Thermopetrobacter sp. TC1]
MRDPASFSPPSGAVLERFARIVGAQHVLTDAEAMAPYLREWRDRYVGRAAAVLRPGSEEEVAALLKVAHEADVAIVPQGGNTGLVGGQIPYESGAEVVLSLSRLNRVLDIDLDNDTMTLQAGVILADAQTAAKEASRLFPLSLAAEGSCQIGGNLATNAGGLNVIAYGTARAQCLALRAVLADGSVVGSLNGLRKDNTGYDLRDVLIGSEGTLGVITAAVMRLFPAVTDRAVAFAGMESPAEAVSLLTFFRERLQCGVLTAFELMSHLGLSFAVKHLGLRAPLAAPTPWYVLVELSGHGAAGAVMAEMERILGDAFEAGLIEDAALAQNEGQAEAFWRLREGMSEAQKYEGGSIKNDIAVPVSRIAEFIETANARVQALVPGARPVPFGHLGDGNLHYNISQPPDMSREAFLSRWDAVVEAVNEVVLALGGSISAEHGIGRMKRQWLARIKSPAEIALMRQLKQAFDPKGILNPGKLLP